MHVPVASFVGQVLEGGAVHPLLGALSGGVGAASSCAHTPPKQRPHSVRHGRRQAALAV